MRTRIYNARILTMEEDRAVFTGEIHIEDGRIICVSEYDGKGTPEDATANWDEEIDAGGNLIMPGFKNAHIPIHP